MGHSPTIGGISSVQWQEEAEDFKCVSVVYYELESK